MNAPVPAHAPSQPTVGRLRDRVENQARHIETLERCLSAALLRAGLENRTIVLRDQLPRLPITNRHADTHHPLPEPITDPDTDPSWWPSAERRPAPLPAEPGWACFGVGDKVGKVLGISLLGMTDDRVAATVAMIAAQQRKTRDFLPVFLTTSTTFHVFRAHGFVFEYFPARSQRDLISADTSWEDYLGDRLAFVAKKWGITRVICFGAQAIGSW